MPGMTPDARLIALAQKAEEFRNTKKDLLAEAVRKAQALIDQREQELDQLVLQALEEGHSVMDVARAYTPPGSTPNRNKIYDIRRRYSDGTKVASYGDWPFRWEGREVETVNGPRTVYDVIGTLVDFGPDQVNGVFRWRYIAGQLEEVFEFDKPLYPTGKHYQFMLSQWLQMNPYPGGDADA